MKVRGTLRAGYARHAASLACGVLIAAAVAAPRAQAAGWVPAVTGVPSSASATEMSNPAVDAAGDVFVAYADSGHLWLEKRPAGGSFGAPELVATIPAQNAVFGPPKLAADAAGDVVIAWLGGYSGPEVLPYLATVSASGTAGWSVSPLSNPGSGATCGDIADASNSAGEAVVAWQCPSSQKEVVQLVARGAAGQSFGSLTTYGPYGPGGSQPDANATSPAVGVDDAGNVVLAYDQSGDLLEVAGAVGQMPQYPSTLEGDGAAGTPVVASAGDNTIVAWNDDSTSPAVADASLVLGANLNSLLFSNPLQVSQVGAGAVETATLSAAIDDAGDAVVAWKEGTNELAVRANVRPAGGSFSFGEVDVAEDGAGSVYTSASMLPGGPAVVGYMVTGQTEVDPWAGTVSLGDVPGPDVQIGSNVASGTNFAAARADAAGDVVIGWLLPGATGEQVAAYAVAHPTIPSLLVPPSATAGSSAGFSVTAAGTPWSAPSSATWSFGDGTTTSGFSVAHTYAVPGVYTVTVTVADAYGNATSRSAQIDVTPPPQHVSSAPAVCRVPSLTHLTLAGAKSHLKSAHCALGKQTKARRPHSTRGLKYGVLSQSPKSGRTYASGYKVRITLGWYKPPKSKRRK